MPFLLSELGELFHFLVQSTIVNRSCPFSSEYFRRDLRVPVHPVLAMFRMGSKCGVSQLRDEALRRLESFLLSREHVFESNPSKSSALAVVDVVDGWPISVINLARTFDIPGLLPGAFYLCSQLSPATLVGGVRIPSGDIERLSDDDLTICIQGRDKLISRSIAVAAQMVSLASQGFGCSGPGSCASRVQDFFLTTKHTSPREISAPILTSISICRGCQSQLTRTVTNYSTQTWKSLGGYFQLLPS